MSEKPPLTEIPSKVISLDFYRKTEAPIKKAKSLPLNTLGRLEGELIFRTGKIAEQLDEHNARIQNLEKVVEQLLRAVQILAVNLEGISNKR